jgi:hypothetical protein
MSRARMDSRSSIEGKNKEFIYFQTKQKLRKASLEYSYPTAGRGQASY